MRHDDDDGKIPRAILLVVENEVKKQLKEQQAWQQDEIHHSLKCMHEESVKIYREEIQALELKVAGLVRAVHWNNSNKEQEKDEQQSAVLSLPIPKRNGSTCKGDDGDDEITSNPILVRDPCPPLRDDYFNNHDELRNVGTTKDEDEDEDEDDSSSTTSRPPQSLATGIMKSLQSIFQTDDKSGDDDNLSMDVKEHDTPALYLNDDQEAQMGTRTDAASRLGLCKIPSRASTTLSGEKKRNISEITTRGLNPSLTADTQSLPQARKHVEGFQLHPARFQEQEGGMRCFSKFVTMPKRKPRRTFKKRFIFSIIPVPTSKSSDANDRRDHEDGLELEEDTFTLMMLNKTYGAYRLPHHVDKIMTNCFRVLLIAFGILWELLGMPVLPYLVGLLGGNEDFLWYDFLRSILMFAISLCAIFGSRRISLLFSRILRTILTPLSGPWFLGIVTFAIFQFTLGISIIVDQWSACTENINTDEGCIPFDIPMHVGLGVNVAQCVTVVLVLATQTDILSSIKTVYILRNADHIPWDRVIGEEGNRTWCLWLRRILLPNVLKFIQADVVLFASFIIIVQSTKTLDLLKDFTALLAVSDADNILFYLAAMGYLGENMRSKTEEVKSVADRCGAKGEGQNIAQQEETEVIGTRSEAKTKGVEHEAKAGNVVARSVVLKSRFGNFNPNSLVCMFVVLCSTMIAGLSFCINGQWNGRWLSTKYPDCKVRRPRWIGNGKCNQNVPYFTEECGWDGGDCPMGVPEGYYNCTVAYPNKIGDGQCDNFLPYNSDRCGYDGGDCIPKAVEGYPNCVIVQASHQFIGDGTCYDRPPYNTLECGYDGGDCDDPKAVDGYPSCFVSVTYTFDDGECYDYPPYNTLECGFDGGDCASVKEERNVRGYSNCFVQYRHWIGDGRCHDHPPYNTLECEYDGGDCIPQPGGSPKKIWYDY